MLILVPSAFGDEYLLQGTECGSRSDTTASLATGPLCLLGPRAGACSMPAPPAHRADVRIAALVERAATARLGVEQPTDLGLRTYHVGMATRLVEQSRGHRAKRKTLRRRGKTAERRRPQRPLLNRIRARLGPVALRQTE